MTEQEPRTIRKIRSITLLLAAAAFMAVVSGGSGFVVQAVPGAPIADNAAGGDDGGAKGSVWVVNRDLGELAIFDAETGTLLEKLAVGSGSARHLHLGESRQGLHHGRGGQCGHDGRPRDTGERVDSCRTAAASYRAEP